MPRFFDHEGNEISAEEYVDLLHIKHYRVIAETTVHRRWFVSTHWVGLDLATEGRALYFETTIQDIDPCSGRMESLAKYPTKQAALTGHRYLIKQIRGGRLRPFSKH